MNRLSLRKTHRWNLHRPPDFVIRSYASLFRTSVANRLRTSSVVGWSTRKLQEETEREARQKLVSKIEPLVRERLRNEFPREFQASWFADDFGGRHSPPLTLSSFKTLLALNGFHRVAKPSGNKHRLYLAEGVVATPPMKLSFNAMSIPFASGYQEFARGMDIERAGVFGDVHNHIATVTQGNKTRDRLFAQPIEQSFLHPDDGTPKRQCDVDDRHPTPEFPEFVQEDITLYRVAENSAARVIDSTYSRWTSWTQRRFVRPLKDAKYRTRVAIKSMNAMNAKFHEILEKSLAERIWEQVSKMRNRRIESKSNIVVANELSILPDEHGTTMPNIQLEGEKDEKQRIKETKTETTAEKESQEKSTNESEKSEQKKKEKDAAVHVEEKVVDPLETLVVISSHPRLKDVTPKPNPTPEKRITDDGDEIVDSVALYRRMTPSTRILALPDYYVLRHSSASTLVSVSLVVFGAIPLAYRSYIFSINYDWLVGSGLIATSVIATITYGIVSWRWRARTSQSKTVHEALGARVGARDEAALLLLKEGAVRSVVGQILDVQSNASKENVCVNDALIDPMEWAIDFGIVEEEPNVNDNDDVKKEA